MFTAFARYPDGTCDTLLAADAVAESWQKDGSALWIDIEEPDEETLRTVGSVFNLAAEALEDCLYGEQRPRIDEYEDHIFLVLYGMLSVGNDDQFDPRKLAVFCGSRFLLTVHRDPLATIGEIRSRCRRHPSLVLGRGVDSVLYSIIDGMVDKYAAVSQTYDRRLDELEEISLSPSVDESILVDISEMRRNLLELKHVAASQRDLLVPVARGEYDYISETLEARFAHVRDHLTKVVESIDAQRELLNAIRDNYHSALADRMNDTVKTLTIIATILLPLSLIAGVYGMNLPLWPPPEERWSFWVIIGTMVALGSGMLVYFRKRRWL